MKSLTFITGNLNKLKWTQRYIHIPLEHKKLDLVEIQSLDSRTVVEHKVKEAFSIVKNPVLVEDTSLIFNAWGNLPGTFVKYFVEELGNEGLCKLLTASDRSAIAKATYGVFDGNKLFFFEGSIQGSIATMPIGNEGFGWNPIFIPNGCEKTYAEMTDEEIDQVSIRKIALEKMRKELINE
jgi:inosine triphosphate pyrophosphatase